MNNLNLFSSIFIFFLTICTAEAQWIQQNSGTNQNLYDVEFINEKTGWAVGDGGVVVKTTNAGTNWVNLPNPSPSLSPNLWSVEPIDSNIIYITSGKDLIIKTTNGGINWDILNYCADCNSAMIGIFFLNKDTGWFLGANKVFRTFDGGQTLDSFYAPWFTNFEIYFKDVNTGIFSGDGRVFKTTDGGMNWFDTNVPTGRFYMFRKISVVNNKVWLVASGDPPVFYSNDFCETWNIIDTIECYPPAVMYSVAFADELTGWAGGSYGWLFRTTNGGYSWIKEETSGDQRFWGSIYCTSDSIVWGVGGAGKIQHTTTSGQTIVNIKTQNTYIADEFELTSVYPNPFNNQTKVNLSIDLNAVYKLEVFNLAGKKTDEIFNKFLIRGTYETTYNAGNLSSGIYFFKISSGNKYKVKKFVLIK